MTKYVLTLSCPDRLGVVANISQGLVQLGANILANAEFQEKETNTFCMRSVFETNDHPAETIIATLEEQARELHAKIAVRDLSQPRRALLMVSAYDHCLLDLLYRKNCGELHLEIPLVVSNHPDLEELCRYHTTDFLHLPVTTVSKEEVELRLEELFIEKQIDFIVLARYMQILSASFCQKFEGKIINIHHSFLPGFKGANPYGQAWQRGVKLIGATAHYVTEELDEGPIITQEVTPVSHKDDIASMKHAGRDLERLVLSKAVKAQAEDRIFLVGKKTVIF